MSESTISITSGSGTLLHTATTTIGGNTVHNEFGLPGEYPYATYVAFAGNISVATANDHILQVMAGGTLNVKIRRIRVTQHAAVTTAGLGVFQIVRLTTAGTGGTSSGALGRFDTSDAASGATAMTLPSAKGTESTILLQDSANFRQTAPTAGGPNVVFEWIQMPNSKPIVIASGTSNGIAIKSTAALAAGTVNVWIELVEQNH